jgi:hypothetical protein
LCLYVLLINLSWFSRSWIAFYFSSSAYSSAVFCVSPYVFPASMFLEVFKSLFLPIGISVLLVPCSSASGFEGSKNFEMKFFHGDSIRILFYSASSYLLIASSLLTSVNQLNIMEDQEYIDALKLTPEQLQDFKEAFSLFDHDDSGMIS